MCYDFLKSHLLLWKSKKRHLIHLYCITIWCEICEYLKSEGIYFLLGQPPGVTLNHKADPSSDLRCLYHLLIVRNYIRHLNAGPWTAHGTYLTDADYTLSLLNGCGVGLAFPLNTVAQDKSTLPCEDFTVSESANPGDSCISFQLHAAPQSHLVILTGSQAGTASFRMICFFSCLSLPVSFLSLSQYFPGFVNKGLLCNMLLKLAFKSEIWVLPTSSQYSLWIYNQKAWSGVMKVKTVNNFVKILSTPFQPFSRSTQTSKNWIQLLLSAVLVGFRHTCLLYIQEQATEYDPAKKRNEIRIHTTTWMNLKKHYTK